MCEGGYTHRGASVVCMRFCSVEMMGVVCVEARIPIGDMRPDSCGRRLLYHPSILSSLIGSSQRDYEPAQLPAASFAPVSISL